MTSSWSTLGNGLNNGVLALAVLPNGDLVAGGAFTQAGGSNADCVARWDGSTWSPLGLGVNDRIALWDGATWSALGAGVDSLVTSMTLLPGGDLAVGGYFTHADGQPAN